jgi:cephalosporin hydroxylase
MFDRAEFEKTKRHHAEGLAKDTILRKQARDLILAADHHGFLHQWCWLGMPIVQLPTDVFAIQEIVWEEKPDIIIETGIAWGGSLIFYASLLQLLGKGEVVGVDLNLMDHVTAQIMSYPFSHRIHAYKGSSTDPGIVEKIKAHVKPEHSVMLVLDSNHTHEHVLAELDLYAPLVTKGQFVIVCDTYIEESPPQIHRQRPWAPGNNPRTAIMSYLKKVDRFQEDRYIYGKSLMSLMPNGYLRCIK